MNKRQKQLAFTLIELLIYMGILSILLFILTDIFVATLNVKSESESQAAVQQNGRYILAKLMYDINQADSISTDSISLPGNNSDRLKININGSERLYEVLPTNKRLYLTVAGTDSYELNSPETEISGLNFINIGNNPGKSTIQISFTLTSTMIKNTVHEVESFQTTVGLR